MQVHGYILNLIKSNILYIIPAVISTLLIILSLFRAPELNHKTDHNRFAWTILLIIIMLFIFALFAEGNAEFMVMIPVLSFVLVPIFTVNSKKILPLVLSGLALWNISYGLLPLHFKSHANEQFLCDVSGQTNNVIVIAYDGQLLNNMIYYQTGNINRRNIYLSPAALNIKGRDVKILEDIIEDALKAERKIYTDCIGSFATSRATIIEGRFNERFFIRYKTRVVKSWKSSLGERSVCEITGKLY